jgi:hypothetical protein
MKTSLIIAVAFLLAGCESWKSASSLTSAQARAMAVQLANAKAVTLYHCQPFQDRHPAQYTRRHWVWTERCGYGQGDFEARVELASDGSTNSVSVQLMSNISPLIEREWIRPAF